MISRLRALFSRKDVTPEPLDLNEATREVIALSWGRAAEATVILLQSQLAERSPLNHRRSDPKLQQVILNLLRNVAGRDGLVCTIGRAGC